MYVYKISERKNATVKILHWQSFKDPSGWTPLSGGHLRLAGQKIMNSPFDIKYKIQNFQNFKIIFSYISSYIVLKVAHIFMYEMFQWYITRMGRQGSLIKVDILRQFYDIRVIFNLLYMWFKFYSGSFSIWVIHSVHLNNLSPTANGLPPFPYMFPLS